MPKMLKQKALQLACKLVRYGFTKNHRMVKTEAKGQSAVGPHGFSVWLTIKEIIFEVVYAIWKLDKVVILTLQ